MPDPINKLFVYGTLGPGRPNEHWLTNIGGTYEEACVRGRLYPEGWGATLGYPALVIDPDGFWSGAFERWGFPVWFMFLIGFLECLGAILILIPRTGTYGGLIIAVVMAGALITRSIHGASTTDLVWIFLFGLGGALIAWGRFRQRWKLKK